jgi:signal transduction histidine kinase
MLKFYRNDHSNHPVADVFNRYYWLQIVLIAMSIVVGLACSAWVIKGSLLKTALEQEMEHYWIRVQRNLNANLPDTKNLYGYRWFTNNPPPRFKSYTFKPGVNRMFIDGKDRMTVYGEKNGQHVLLVFGESNVNKLIWLFGLAPLMFSLSVLYSFLWWSNRRAKRYFSPITRLANALEQIDWAHQTEQSPFAQISTNGNLEAEYLKQALEKYHQVLTEFIRREREFTGDVSHELRTPLTILKGNLQLCQVKFGQDKSLLRMHNTIEDMQLLVDTLLAIARNTTSNLNTEHYYLSKIVDDLVMDLADMSQVKGIDIATQYEEAEQKRWLYPSMTKMVLSNILRNALNYSQGSQIDIILQKNSLIIADNGIGLDLPNDAKVQELNESQLKLDVKGHGIGLQLVQKLCKQLNWRVELFDRQYYLLTHPELMLQNTTGLIVVVYLC